MRVAAAQRIMIVAGACAAALVGLVLSESAARKSGVEIRLPIEAVDPRALLSGHYVLVSPTQRLAPPDTCPLDGDWKWVALRRRGDIHVVAGGATSRDQAELLGPLALRGTFSCAEPSAALEDAPAQPGWIRLHVGADRFHTDQAAALRIEAILREQAPNAETRAFALMSVGRDGRARLVGLEIHGERIELRWP